MRRALALAGSGLIAACAQRDLPPRISYDSEDFAPAAIAAEPPRPVEIVTVPEPLPLPGQLRPVPEAATQPEEDHRPPEERVVAANAAASVEPTERGYINAIQVYPYTAGALYQLYTAPEQVSDIALQPGEGIIAVSAGDTVRWIIGDTVSGSGAAERVHVLVKPIAEGLRTNLVITTDRRVYHLELQSTPETYMASVSWHYPQDELLALERRNIVAEAAAEQVVDRGLDIDNLRFRYAISGDDPPWRPVRVFDDTLHPVPGPARPARGAAALRRRPQRRESARQLPGARPLLRRRPAVRRRRAAARRGPAAGRAHHPNRRPAGGLGRR